MIENKIREKLVYAPKNFQTIKTVLISLAEEIDKLKTEIQNMREVVRG